MSQYPWLKQYIWQNSLEYYFIHQHINTHTYQDHPQAPEVARLVISRAVEELRRGVLQGKTGGLQRGTAAPRWKQPRKTKINHLQHGVIRLISKQHVLPVEVKKRGTIRDILLCIDNKPQELLCYSHLTSCARFGTVDPIMMHRDVLKRGMRVVLWGGSFKWWLKNLV